MAMWYTPNEMNAKLVKITIVSPSNWGSASVKKENEIVAIPEINNNHHEFIRWFFDCIHIPMEVAPLNSSQKAMY